MLKAKGTKPKSKIICTGQLGFTFFLFFFFNIYTGSVGDNKQETDAGATLAAQSTDVYQEAIAQREGQLRREQQFRMKLEEQLAEMRSRLAVGLFSESILLGFSSNGGHIWHWTRHLRHEFAMYGAGRGGAATECRVCGDSSSGRGASPP